MQHVERHLVDTHLWVAAAAAGLELFSSHALGLPLLMAPAALVAASTLLIYRADGWIDKDRPSRGVLPVVLALGVFAWSWTLAPDAVRWLVGFGALPCLVYGWRWRGRRCLRELPGIKPFFVSGALIVSTIGIPCLWSTQGVDPVRLNILAGMLFALLMGNVTLFDLRDQGADAGRGIVTVPVVLGANKTRYGIAICSVLLGLAPLLTMQRVFSAQIHHCFTMAFVGTAICAVSLVPDSSRLRYAMCVDGIPLVLGVATLVIAS